MFEVFGSKEPPIRVLLPLTSSSEIRVVVSSATLLGLIYSEKIGQTSEVK